MNYNRSILLNDISAETEKNPIASISATYTVASSTSSISPTFPILFVILNAMKDLISSPCPLQRGILVKYLTNKKLKR